jgi:hypothetical protein
MLRYEIILYWSEEDQGFIAEVPELSGCAAVYLKGGFSCVAAVETAELTLSCTNEYPPYPTRGFIAVLTCIHHTVGTRYQRPYE